MLSAPSSCDSDVISIFTCCLRALHLCLIVDFFFPCSNTGLIMPNEKDFASLFQTVDEHPEPINAEVKGNLPSWLRGTLLRNGPGKFECGDTSFKHLFDAQALLHRFHIEDGHVTYSNRFIRSESYADSLKRGDSIHMQFGTFIPPDPCQNIFSRLFSWFWKEEIGRDNTLVNVFPIKGKTYAATETNFIYEIDPKTLETLKRVDLLKEFPGNDINQKLCSMSLAPLFHTLSRLGRPD